MVILVINSGSSSIKYRLFDVVDKSVLAAGLLEQIGEAGSRLTHRPRRGQGDMAEIIIDPANIFYLGRQAGYSPQEIESMLNKQSGLKGISGLNDMREIGPLAAKGNKTARLAIDMYCYRI